MNYQEQYDNLISFAKLQKRKKVKTSQPDYICYENHHIIPEHFYINRSRKGPPGWLEGNPEDPANKVLLTLEEHFDAHQLLALIYPDNYGLLNAVVRMSGKFTITREEFTEIRTNFARLQGEKVSGEKSYFYGKHFDKSGMNNAMFGLLGTNHPKFGFKESEETKMKKSINSKGKNKGMIPWNKNKTKETDERLKKTGENISKAKKGVKIGPQKKKRGPWSEEEKQKRSKPIKKIQCPHCELIGGMNNMHRYHFDNCKNKN